MNLEEVGVHVEMKKKFDNYPTVPEAAYSETESGHRDSVIRGFKKRVSMWQVDHQPSLMAEEGEVFVIVEELEAL